MVQHLIWLGVYLRSTLSNNILQKILTLVPLKATVQKVFVATITTFLSDSYYALEDTLTHVKILKLKGYAGGDVRDCCAEILFDAERL